MRCQLLTICLFLIVLESSAWLPGEESTLDKCLKNYGGMNTALLERLQRYTQWSDSYEEVPCFTQCYLNEMFDIYSDIAGFDEERTKQRFGEAVYNACRDRLQPNQLGYGGKEQSSCERAYAGFHCIASLENDPLILIDNLPNITDAAKSAMKECLQKTDRVLWDRFGDYSRFPVTEPIPCFTHCFIGKLELFDKHKNRWRLPAMRQMLGVPGVGAKVSSCPRRRARNPCAAAYQQFTCFVLAVK
ncbi:uncharacterized protein LOC6569844 [Drosophila grimshawi]|uniref:GH14012 n=1 Tax=Drosophila grimshawi TaxID=7222 RepID=B4JYG9_DROGR|nr:uncharacterized protein LOC6569844 [Drosophila grimshawi]XP_032597475.1 uncharacterized protein LOC6569844 [Drosophila grimshawi]EDV90731.1 GH14012 [Drosophila grimshawi]